ncbi:MAG: aminoglycoside phosphotransferase family protein [Anaerolineaceae bacterium]|nr:aminoglycoside phosphotransferase family protein [Anaerolineaceae bacterium]
MQLTRQDIDISGEIQQPHVRPWSTVLNVPTARGILYFKATAAALAHEVALTQTLSQWRPDCMPRVLASNPERGWMLLHDEGPMLRSLIQSTKDIHHWQHVLPVYALMQIEMSARQNELLALGALDRRLAVLPEKYALLLDDKEALSIDHPQGLTSKEYQRLCELAPKFNSMCKKLADYRIPETLHHDDFHDGNIFVRNGRYVFADWGESCVAHPFFSMLVTMRSSAYSLKLEEGAPELEWLRDIYLEPWRRYGSCKNLLNAFDLAQRIGMVSRALTWYLVVSHLEEPFKKEYADAVPGWLQEFHKTEALSS